jgi:hypothetical protein
MRYELKTISRWCVGVAWAYAVINILYALALGWEISVLNRIEDGTFDWVSFEGEWIDPAIQGVSIGLITLTIISFILGAVWMYRAAANAGELDPDTSRISPSWSVIWWAVPIANLWMPLRAVKQVWNSSHGLRLEEATPGFFGLWWACWIISYLMGNISSRMANSPNTDTYITASWLDIVGTPLTVVAAYLWVRIIRSISEAQADGHNAAKVFE